MTTITVPMPTGGKWLNSNQRIHRMQEATLTKQWRQAGHDAALGHKPITCPVRVIAYITKPRAGRYDPGNLYPTAKAVLDGFTDAHLWPDDSHQYVIGPDMRHAGKGPAQLTITITPWTGEQP